MFFRILCWFFLGSISFAQIAIIPLDSRPITRAFPLKLTELAGVAATAPSIDVLGNLHRAAQFSSIENWLMQHGDSTALFVSLDAVAYGGLVQSRQDDVSLALALERLNMLKRWKTRYQKPIYAYIIIPRFPDTQSRSRNLALIKHMLAWQKQGFFANLRVTWDDAQKNSPALQELKILQKLAAPEVLFSPGADEVMSAMVAKYLSPKPKRIKIRFSDESEKFKIMPYDALPLFETVRLHAESVGFELVYGTQDADLNLYVFNNFRGNVQNYARAIAQIPPPVSVVDIQNVNLGNRYLWEALDRQGTTPKLLSLGAWGTPGNNLGTALAHAKLALDKPEPAKQSEFLAYVYATDIAYNSNIRPELRKLYPFGEVTSGVAFQMRGLLSKYTIFNQYTIVGAEFPWQRLMEVDLQLARK